MRARRTTIAVIGTVLASISMSACATIAPSDRVDCVPSEAVATTSTGTGSGPVVTDNGIVTFTLEVTEDATGAEIIPKGPLYTAADGSAAPINLALVGQGGYPGVVEMMRCGQAGQTLTASMPASTLLAPQFSQQLANPDASYTATVEIDRVFHSAATGRIEPQRSGIPAVVTAPDGTPGVTMPKEPVPDEIRTATTISGFSMPVAAGDRVTLQVSAFAWSSGQRLGTTWANAGPALQLIAGPDDTLYGVTENLIGANVGSQVVVVMPPAALAGQGLFGPGFGAGDAVVFVIDVLGADAV